MEQRESEIQKAALNWLRLQPKTFVWKNHKTGIPDGRGGFRKNYAGAISDITGVKNGRAFAMEVKRLSVKKIPEHQEDWLKAFDSAGGYACVIRSLDDCQEAFFEI